jgi:hypothetical protein
MRRPTFPHKTTTLDFLILLLASSALILNSAPARVHANPLNGPRTHNLGERSVGHSVTSTTAQHLIQQQQQQPFDKHSKVPSAPANNSPSVLETDSTTVQRLRQVVHETNKVILLTNGDQIKLYPLKESDLTPSGGYYVIQSKLNYTTIGWKRPLISDVGYIFDNRFCTSSNQPWIVKSNCLVIFWLDKRNKFLRYGSFMFKQSSRIELLSSEFNAYGNLKSLSGKNMKTIWLDELPPIDVCKRARELDYRLADCEVLNMSINRSNQELSVSLNISVLSNTSHRQARKYEIGTMSAQTGKTHLDFQTINVSSFNHKNVGIPDAVAMTVNKFRCQCFWMNANKELYSSNFAGEDVQFIEKLSPRPAVRMLGEMQSYRDILFFSDVATKSIMSYNITKRANLIRQNKPLESTKKKFDMVQRLDSTHSVLLVETSTINKFAIIDLKEGAWETESACKMERPGRLEEPRVIDDDLTDHLKKQKLYSDYEKDLCESIVHMTLIVLAILLIIVVITEKRRVKQAKPDRKSFVNHVDS